MYNTRKSMLWKLCSSQRQRQLISVRIYRERVYRE